MIDTTDRYIFDEDDVVVTHEKSYAAGVPAVLVSLSRGLEQMGPVRTARTLWKLNQRDGFDCPGCAWPETPGHRKHAEFCENGAKAVAEEATTRTVTPEFFAEHSVADLLGRTEFWLGQQGRLTHPMVLLPGASHYEPIGWDAAFAMIAGELRALASPHEAVFYTSGRTSNEAAFVYQLMIRAFGTNNLPDCSNMCHESSGSALVETIGIGKGSVTVPDIENADLILIAGQNPGTNHPRMLSTLEKAKANGARVIAINPLPEAGLLRFKDPQKVHGVVGDGVQIADEFLQIRIGGDQALFQGFGPVAARGGGPHSRDGAGPRVHRPAHRRVRGVRGASAAGRSRHRRPGHRVVARTDPGHGGGVDRLEKDDHLLGDGVDPAKARGRDHSRCGEPAAVAGDDRQTRGRGVPGPRALERAG